VERTTVRRSLHRLVRPFAWLLTGVSVYVSDDLVVVKGNDLLFVALESVIGRRPQYKLIASNMPATTANILVDRQLLVRSRNTIMLDAPAVIGVENDCSVRPAFNV